MRPHSYMPLAVFLRIYGWISIILFSVLLIAFNVNTTALQDGGSLQWLIWDKVTDHVGPMLFSIYIVWSIFLVRAANDSQRHAFFLSFSTWANVAHVAVMVPQAMSMHHYHSKFLTDIPWILLLPAGILLLTPKRGLAPSQA